MYTAEIVRRQQMAAHWRLREQQLLLMEAMKPLAEAWGKKVREAYPELFVGPVTNGDRK